VRGYAPWQERRRPNIALVCGHSLCEVWVGNQLYFRFPEMGWVSRLRLRRTLETAALVWLLAPSDSAPQRQTSLVEAVAWHDATST
jgi:hypothetical protein